MSTTALLPRRVPRPAATSLPLAVPAYATPAQVAAAVAARRDLWAAHVRFDPTVPHQAVVWHDERWEVVLGAWLPGQASATVEHVGRPGALHVLQGELDETTWVTATDGPTPGRRHAVVRRHATGTTRSHGTVHVHDVRNAGADPALALSVRARV